jgi:hypothetical protein
MQDIGGTRKNPRKQEQWDAMEKTMGNHEKRGGYAALSEATEPWPRSLAAAKIRR